MMIRENVCSGDEHGHAKCPMLQSHGSGKAFLGEVQRNSKSFLCLSVNIDSMSIKCPPQLSSPNVYGLKTMPYGALPTDISETNFLVQLYVITPPCLCIYNNYA